RAPGPAGHAPSRRRVTVTAGRVARAGAWLVVTLRWLVVAAWAAAAAWIAWTGPNPSRNAAPVISLVPSNAPALRVEARELRLFSLPLSTDTAIVQRSPSGISAADQAAALRLAAHQDAGRSGPG